MATNPQPARKPAQAPPAPRLTPHRIHETPGRTTPVGEPSQPPQSQSVRAANEVDRLLGSRLRQARLFRGMSQEALGHELGVSFQQVQKYEKGNNRISASTLLRITQALQVGFDHFFAGSDALLTPPVQNTDPKVGGYPVPVGGGRWAISIAGEPNAALAAGQVIVAFGSPETEEGAPVWWDSIRRAYNGDEAGQLIAGWVFNEHLCPGLAILQSTGG